ncbi:hypothetical protein [Aureimonas glaciei]|uniref:Uncharacterized protein n=1 Tax=Aureimonas glaciei TaxID=1776957 RepID=A0A916YG23_9HYPH|nr:hypothetical protein [Aureimonas glaciei]GGD43826.1 hypothetical protein GCM10011335_53070 [Aureimonas glaciei]
MLSRTPIIETLASDGLVWVDRRPTWDEQDPSRGTAYRGEQAALVSRWDVRSFADEFSSRFRLSANAARIAMELWSEATTLGRWTSYSRSDEFYALFHDSVLHTKRRVCGGIDELERAGLVENWRQKKYVFGWQSACRAKLELVQMVQAVIDAGIRPYPHRPERSLLVRDEDGEPIPIRSSDETRRMARQVDALNTGIRNASISNGMAACLRRIFHGNLQRGGRLYALGGAWQVLSKKQRAQITIDGCRVVEFDYGSMHATMLYRDAGLVPPRDAYDLPDWDRDLQKAAFVIMINADDEDQAIHAISKKDEIWAVAVPDTDDARIAATALYRELAHRHRAISDAFSSDAGAGLMRRESDMIVEILMAMRRAGETVLPVHDSLIARESAGDLLMTEMRAAADRAGLLGIRIEKVEIDDDVREGSSPCGIRLCSQNVMSYPLSFFLPSSPSLTIQNLALTGDASILTGAARKDPATVSTDSDATGLNAAEAQISIGADIPLPEAESGSWDHLEQPEAISLTVISVPDDAQVAGITDSAAGGAADLIYGEMTVLNAPEMESQADTSNSTSDAEMRPQPHPDAIRRGQFIGMTLSIGGSMKVVSFDRILAAISAAKNPIVLQEPITVMSQSRTPRSAGRRLMLNSLFGDAVVWTDPAGSTTVDLSIAGRPPETETAASHEAGIERALQFLRSVEDPRWPQDAYCAVYDGPYNPNFSLDENRARFNVGRRPWPITPQPRFRGHLDADRVKPAPAVPMPEPVMPAQGTLVCPEARGIGWRRLQVARDGSALTDVWQTLRPQYRGFGKPGNIAEFQASVAPILLHAAGVDIVLGSTTHAEAMAIGRRFVGDWNIRVIYEGEYDADLSLDENLKRQSAAKIARRQREAEPDKPRWENHEIPDDIWIRPYGAASDIKSAAARQNAAFSRRGLKPTPDHA